MSMEPKHPHPRALLAGLLERAVLLLIAGIAGYSIASVTRVDDVKESWKIAASANAHSEVYVMMLKQCLDAR